MSNPRQRRKPRLAAGIAILSLVASLAVVGVVAAASPANAAFASACSGASDTHFTDHPGDAANCLFDYGIAKGKADGTFGENDDLIRSQFASFVTRFLDAAGVTHTARTPFRDVTPATVPDANVLQEIEEGHAAGVVNGFSDHSAQVVNGDLCAGTPCQPGDFGPQYPMSVAQGCTIVLNMMDAIHAANPSAPAGGSTGDPSTDYDHCVAIGIIDLGATDAGGTTYPNGKTDTIKRGLFADMLAQALQKEVTAGVIPNHYTTSNQDFTPDTGANGSPTINTFSPTGAGGSGLKTKTVTFTGLGTDDVSVALLPCAGDNGAAGFVYYNGATVSFRDLDTNNPNSTPDNMADAVGVPGWDATSPVSSFNAPGTFNEGGTDGELELLSTNGNPVSNGGYETGVTPDAGVVTVAVSNFSDEGDCGQVLVWQDDNTDDALNLDAANKPTELFGVSGPLVWTGGEAPSGSSGGDVVYYDSVNHIMYTDDTNGVFYKIHTNDSPFYDEQVQGNGAFPITVAEFEKYISSGDNFGFQSGGYSASGGNQYLQEYDFGQTPMNVTATQGDFDTDSGAAPDDVKLTIGSLPTDVLIDHICAYRDGAGINNQVTGTNCTADGSGASTTIVDSNPGPGVFHYRVSVVGQADDESDWSEPVTVTVTTPVGPVAGAPLSDSAVHTDGNSDGIVNDGDILINTFNETMNDPAADAQLGICDGDGTCGLLQNGVNATFAKVAANRTVVIVGPAGPVIVANGGNGTLDYASGACLGFGPPGVCAVNLPAPADTHGFTDTDENLQWTNTPPSPIMNGADPAY